MKENLTIHERFIGELAQAFQELSLGGLNEKDTEANKQAMLKQGRADILYDLDREFLEKIQKQK